jgi:hypothetical protein
MSLVEGNDGEKVYSRKHVDTTSVDVKVSLASSLVLDMWGQSLVKVVGPSWVAMVGVAGCMGISRVGCRNVLIALSPLVEGGVGKKSVSSGLKRQVA